MSLYNQIESLHRLVKQAIDSGAATSIEEAETLFSGYRLRFAIRESEAQSPADQVALLTGVALARRVFLGGVDVIDPRGQLGDLVLDLGKLGEPVGGRIGGGKIVEAAGEGRNARFEIVESRAATRLAGDRFVEALGKRLNMRVETGEFRPFAGAEFGDLRRQRL